MRTPLGEVLSGLAPARSAACPRCGSATLAFANGRGRVDICHKCGIAEAATAEGFELFSMKGIDASLRKPKGP